MLLATKTTWRDKVALLAEGVDRNMTNDQMAEAKEASPSSRRAWIEITEGWAGVFKLGVALLAEGVDRNLNS